MAVTPNFSWPTPDDTAFVRDGAAAIRALGDAVDGTVDGIDGRLTTAEGDLAEKAPLHFVENVQTTNYTLQLSDTAKVVAIDSASNRTVTVPTNASVAFPIGTVVNVYRAGTGTVTISGASGVTVRNVGTIPSQFGERSLRKRGTNEWVLI